MHVTAFMHELIRFAFMKYLVWLTKEFDLPHIRCPWATGWTSLSKEVVSEPIFVFQLKNCIFLNLAQLNMLAKYIYIWLAKYLAN